MNFAKNNLTYKDSGVNIKAADDLIDVIKPFAKKTIRNGVLKGIGGFGALFEIANSFKEPVLVSSTDGVGTKLKLAFEFNKHNTIGIDLVAMSVNDILVQGAEPLFFLDYFACGKLNISQTKEVIKGIADGCLLAGCSLIGGETAEMPGMYQNGEYDLAGFAVGVVEKKKIIDGSEINVGDIILGIESSGVHSNGYSLIRKVLQISKLDLSSKFQGSTLLDAFLKPTRIYVKPILNLMKKVSIHGLVHITGGGIINNIPRILNSNLTAVINKKSWEIPDLFKIIKTEGKISLDEMYRVFNCGIGMIIIVNQNDIDLVQSELSKFGEKVFRIGHIRKRKDDELQTLII